MKTRNGIVSREEEASVRVGESHHLAGDLLGIRRAHTSAHNLDLFELGERILACAKLLSNFVQ